MSAGSGGEWVGPDVEFRQSKHDGERRQMAWKTDGLSGAPLEIVRGDKDSAKWVEKGLLRQEWGCALEGRKRVR